MSSLDGQQVEVLGRSALIAALVTDGLEIAQPERDAGIDLLAYTHRPWRVVPIQMKAASGEVFSIDRKYEPRQGLVMAYVWNARSAETVELYALPWTGAVAVADDLGWTATHSWEAGGKYSTSRPSARVRKALTPHRMRPGSWPPVGIEYLSGLYTSCESVTFGRAGRAHGTGCDGSHSASEAAS